jgi:serine O-acetyltransferase
MKKKAKEYIEADLYRYYGDSGVPLLWRIFPPLQHKYLIALRNAQYRNNVLLKIFWRLKLRWLQKKTLIQISRNTEIGKGLYIGHIGAIAVNENAKIGKNCNITFGVVIGADNRANRMGAPTIGNNVWIGTNAIIVGKIEIGNDVLIAPNAFVNFDVPSHSVVIGNPGSIHQKKFATKGFISNEAL